MDLITYILTILGAFFIVLATFVFKKNRTQQITVGPLVKVSDGRCGVCAEQMKGDVRYCTRCGTPHHTDCWEFNQGCSVLYCEQNVKMQKVENHATKKKIITEIAELNRISNKRLRILAEKVEFSYIQMAEEIEPRFKIAKSDRNEIGHKIIFFPEVSESVFDCCSEYYCKHMWNVIYLDVRELLAPLCSTLPVIIIYKKANSSAHYSRLPKGWNLSYSFNREGYNGIYDFSKKDFSRKNSSGSSVYDFITDKSILSNMGANGLSPIDKKLAILCKLNAFRELYFDREKEIDSLTQEKKMLEDSLSSLKEGLEQSLLQLPIEVKQLTEKNQTPTTEKEGELCKQQMT